MDPQIAVLELSSSEFTTLISPGTHPRYVRTGHIVYGGGDGTLRAVPFDVDRLEVVGNPVTLLDGVMTKSEGSTSFAIGDNGSLAYVTGFAPKLTRLVWVDRSGKEELVETVPMAFDLPRLSPDGRRVAVEIEGDGNTDLYVIDLDRGTTARLTRDLQEDTSPLWNEDGTEIIFGSLRDGGGIFKIAADGSGAVERLGEGGGGVARQPHAWSGEHDRVVFYQSGGPRVGDIYFLDIATSEISPLLASPDVMEAHPSVSPDGRWLAYTGSDSGRLEVYVRPFPNVDDRRVLVSDAGGNEPLWSRDGREIFYWDDETRSMMAVPVTLEPTFRAGIPVRLFEGSYLFLQAGRHYDVSADGQRFLMLKPVSETDTDSAADAQIVIVQNWLAELERRVPASR